MPKKRISFWFLSTKVTSGRGAASSLPFCLLSFAGSCFKWLEDILTNWSLFFQPSGSSKSSGKRTKRGPNKKLKEGVKYNIEAIRPNGEPLAPKKIADKFVRQCGVLVKDQLPISLQEWREPAKDKPLRCCLEIRSRHNLLHSDHHLAREDCVWYWTGPLLLFETMYSRLYLLFEIIFDDAYYVLWLIQFFLINWLHPCIVIWIYFFWIS